MILKSKESGGTKKTVVRTIKNKSGVQKPLKKTRSNRKAIRVGKFKN